MRRLYLPAIAAAALVAAPLAFAAGTGSMSSGTQTQGTAAGTATSSQYKNSAGGNASASGASAMSEEESLTGTVKSFDNKAHTVTLDNVVFQLPTGFKDPGLKKGEQVKISWTEQNRADETVMIMKR